MQVHRAVYETWVGLIPENADIDHMDSNRENNQVYNLQAVDRAQHSILTKQRIEQKVYKNGYEAGYTQGFQDAINKRN